MLRALGSSLQHCIKIRVEVHASDPSTGEVDQKLKVILVCIDQSRLCKTLKKKKKKKVGLLTVGVKSVSRSFALKDKQTKNNPKLKCIPGMVAYAFNSSCHEIVTGRSL